MTEFAEFGDLAAELQALLKVGRVGVVLVKSTEVNVSQQPFVLRDGALLMAATRTTFGTSFHLYDADHLDAVRTNPAKATITPAALDLDPPSAANTAATRSAPALQSPSSHAASAPSAAAPYES